MNTVGNVESGKLHRLDGGYTDHGQFVGVTVDPCSWMYRGYPLQVSCVGLRTKATVSDRKLSELDATPEQVQAMLEAGLSVEPCDKCGQLHFFRNADKDHSPKIAEANGDRMHTCEPCWLEQWEKEWKEIEAKEAAKEKKRDDKARRDGFTHKLVAWVHPPRGDDYQIVAYAKSEPTKAEIEAILRKRKSRRLDDYSVTLL